LIRDYLSRESQITMFHYTAELSKGSNEQSDLLQTDRPFYPIAYSNLVYTGKSNCTEEPKEWYKLATGVWKELQSIATLPEFVPNSMYAQLYNENGSMATHKDEFVDYGVSVSLGASCDFTFDKETIILNTGDIFVTDFSQVEHGVPRIHDNPPGWWPTTYDLERKGCENVARTRMSIQVRDVKQTAETKMTTNEFTQFIGKNEAQ